MNVKKMLNKRVLVSRIKQSESKSLLVVPESAKKPTSKGLVLCSASDQIASGDVVLFHPMGGQELEDGNVVLEEDDILMVLDG